MAFPAIAWKQTGLSACWQVVHERNEVAAAKMHFWLERTAFYKVPKSHQDEVAEQCHKPFEQVCCYPCEQL